MHHISDITYRNRRNAGYSHEEALAYPSNVRYRDKIELPDGRWFPSLVEMARATGIDIHTLHKRRERDLHGAELAFEGKHHRGKPQVVQGIPFASQKDVAAHFGVEYQTYLARLQMNWTVEQALGLAPKPGTDRLTIDGVTYPNIQALADAYGKSASFIQRRLAAGATPRQAVGLDPFKMTHLQDVYLVDGVPYDSIAQLADAYGKPYNIIYWRIRNGMDPKTAVTKPVNDIYHVDGVAYDSIAQLAKAYGKPYDLIYRRLQSGMDPKTAVTKPAKPVKDVYLVDGVAYNSIAKLAKAYGKPYDLIYRRIRKGMDPKTAVTKPIRRKR